jgi:microcystin-dependent protein
MSQPYVGEIRMVGFNFAPSGWASCDGSVLSISENEVLFNLIGTTYGGDGQNTFNLPDLRGRQFLHQGNNGQTNYVLGQPGGAEYVTLALGQIPAHRHPPAAASGAGTTPNPAGTVWAGVAGTLRPYQSTAGTAAMAGQAVGSVGSNQPHNNLPPLLAINFIISLFGVFPSQD